MANVFQMFFKYCQKGLWRGRITSQSAPEGRYRTDIPSAKVTEDTETDYLYRAVIHKAEVMEKIGTMIDYPNFRDSVKDRELHDAYLDVWAAMAGVQFPPHTAGFASGDSPTTQTVRPPMAIRNLLARYFVWENICAATPVASLFDHTRCFGPAAHPSKRSLKLRKPATLS